MGCDQFAEIPALLARALAQGLSLEGVGEGLSVGGAKLFLRSQTGNPMDVHMNTGANTWRYLLLQPELSVRTKLRAWLLRPLVSLGAIRDRLDAVEEFAFRTTDRGKFREVLKAVQDLERLVDVIRALRRGCSAHVETRYSRRNKPG